MSARIDSFQGVHCAVNFDLANLSMVQVDGGYVAIDTGSKPSISRPLARQWQEMAGGPIQGLIYTHSHLDHIGGADGFDLSDVPIWAHEDFQQEFRDTQLFNVAYFSRGAKQFGFMLAGDENLSNGIGPALSLGTGPSPPIRLPNRTFEEDVELEIAGRNFVLRSAPGETHDHLFIWLPEQRVLFAGDNLYQAFPNLYSIRGVPPRPVRQWIDSLDEMRRLRPRPELMILGHTSPVQGADRIYQLLTDYRDAIAFVHDSVVRGINAGKTPHELVREIRLPPRLALTLICASNMARLQGRSAASLAGTWGGSTVMLQTSNPSTTTKSLAGSRRN